MNRFEHRPSHRRRFRRRLVGPIVAGVLCGHFSSIAWAHPHGAEHRAHTHDRNSHEASDVHAEASTEDEGSFDVAQLEASTSATDSDSAEPPGDATPTASQIIAETGSEAVEWSPPTHRYMSPEGVDDPFPDTDVRRARSRDAGILLGLGAGFAVAGALTARSTLLPDCDDQNDLTTCAVPDAGEIGLRGGRLFGTVGFAVGSAAFGAFGARELGLVLQQSDRIPFERRRKIAVGMGSGSVALGLAGAVVGSSLLAVGSRRSLRIASSLDSVVTSEDLAVVDEALGEVKVARVGLMVLVSSPVLLATGISLLVHRPKRPRRLSIMPMASIDRVGVQATVRF